MYQKKKKKVSNNKKLYTQDIHDLIQGQTKEKNEDYQNTPRWWTGYTNYDTVIKSRVL